MAYKYDFRVLANNNGNVDNAVGITDRIIYKVFDFVDHNSYEDDLNTIKSFISLFLEFHEEYYLSMYTKKIQENIFYTSYHSEHSGILVYTDEETYPHNLNIKIKKDNYVENVDLSVRITVIGDDEMTAVKLIIENKDKIDIDPVLACDSITYCELVEG